MAVAARAFRLDAPSVNFRPFDSAVASQCVFVYMLLFLALCIHLKTEN